MNNTTKCELDRRNGWRSFVTGDYDRHTDLYFTTYEEGGRHGNVTVRGNMFTSGSTANHAIAFASGGDTLLVADNLFRGPIRTIPPGIDCDEASIQSNVGAEVQQSAA